MTPNLEPSELPVVSYMGDQIRQTAPPTRRARRIAFGRPVFSAAVGSGLAVALAAVLIGVAATNSSPAYAVTRHEDGRVTVTLNLITSIHALNRKMKAMGLGIRAVPAVKGCHSPVRILGADHEPSGPARTLVVYPTGKRGGRLSYGRVTSITLLPPSDTDRTFVMAAGKTGFYIAGEIVEGHVPECFGISTHRPPALLSTHSR